ncbi:MAG: hypothetical protein PF569_01635 [Candidatus Woesearchaeota archaeon]|jgi:hypothetical protein|nr:hypothetical protein [Candidatus Woesearchaeota archaeon]
MSTVNLSASNGVSFGHKHTVVAGDVTDGAIIFDFGTDFPIVASIIVTDDAGIYAPLVDAVITYPADGQVSLADGAITFALVAGQVVSVIAQRDKA